MFEGFEIMFGVLFLAWIYYSSRKRIREQQQEIGRLETARDVDMRLIERLTTENKALIHRIESIKKVTKEI